MVLGSEGQPLDVGRTKRLVTPALLAALWARDKGCTYPGCGRPPQWSDAHQSAHVAHAATQLSASAARCLASGDAPSIQSMFSGDTQGKHENVEKHVVATNTTLILQTRP
jgi:hypothetical protein